MGTGDLMLGWRGGGGGGPCDGLAYTIQGETAILLGMLIAKETGISSGHLDLWLECVFTFA